MSVKLLLDLTQFFRAKKYAELLISKKYTKQFLVEIDCFSLINFVQYSIVDTCVVIVDPIS